MTASNFWIERFASEFIPQIKRYRRIWKERLLPAIGDLELEANAIEQEELRRLATSHDGPDDWRADDIAEQAHEAGLEHFLEFAPFQQGLINMYVVGLFHFIEQQCVLFYREAGGTEQRRLEFDRVKDWLDEHDVHICKFNSWPMLEKLMLAANCVKHGDGISCEKLRKKEPDWFKYTIDDLPELLPSLRRPIQQPLFGQGIYLREATLWELTDAALTFWDELGVALACWT